MRYTARIKQILRFVLGDRIATWLHALRLCWLVLNAKTQEAEMTFIPWFVREGNVVIDIGASGANWTLPLSRQVGSTGRVYAFEADPYYAEVTAKMLFLLGLENVTFFPFGLSDVQETTNLLIRTTGGERVSGRGHVVRSADIQDIQKGRTVEVKLERLDDIATSHPELLSARLIKCDVEGFELMVFRGSLNVLAQARPVVITEVGHARLHGYDDAELFRFFSELGYHCYALGSDGNSLYPLHGRANISEGCSQNLIVIPEELELESESVMIKRDQNFQRPRVDSVGEYRQNLDHDSGTHRYDLTGLTENCGFN